MAVALGQVIHAAAYKLGFMTEKAEPVDIGSAAEGSYDYDYNAALFENPILNIDILFEILGK